MARPRMMVIGLDCAPPSLVFDRYLDSMPNVASLMEHGSWGALRSSEPPITVPAWTCMVTGRDAGELGLYGFRNRVHGATRLEIAKGEAVRAKRVWDWLGEHGYRVAPLFVPLVSPPTPVRGWMVSGFLHAGGTDAWCYPRSLEREIEARFGPYRPDVDDFRADDLDRIYADVVEMTDQHFDIAAWAWERAELDFMMMVEIGVDRFHHAFWRHIDPEHPRHDSDERYREIGRRYYARLDAHIGRLRGLAGDDTTFVVVSDHGARAMHGGFCINDWLRARGDLVLREEPRAPQPLRHEQVDWSRTRAWAEGGYYARVSLNVEGREPRGIVPMGERRSVRDTLRKALGELTDDAGAPIPTRVRVPEDYYREARGFAPDLMVYFDELRLRAVGSVGNPRRVVTENDTGPDTCNHAWDGIFLMSGGRAPAHGRIEGAEIYDLTPTILAAFDVPRPPDLLGRNWLL